MPWPRNPKGGCTRRPAATNPADTHTAAVEVTRVLGNELSEWPRPRERSPDELTCCRLQLPRLSRGRHMRMTSVSEATFGRCHRVHRTTKGPSSHAAGIAMA